jgi:hypothetical protein
MSFFDSNQEVIDIQLTSFGKHLLSKGKFKPVFYSFYDDDVLYGSDYAGVTEASKDAQTRILDETPSLKVQSSVESIDEIIRKRQKMIQETIKDSVFSLNATKEVEFASINLEAENPSFLAFPLGTSIAMSSSAPSWKFTILQGELSSSSQTFTPIDERGRSLSTQNISHIQLSASLYTIKPEVQNSQLLSQPKERINLSDSERPPLVSKVFPDSHYVTVSENALIFAFDEENTDYSNESVEVEFFEITDGGERRMTFLADRSNNIDKEGFLVQTDETSATKPTDLNVDYYFDIKTDHHIGIPRLSSLLPKDKFGNVIFDDPVIDFEVTAPRRNLLIPGGDGVVRIDREDC